jgi:hypothetical protein
MPGWKRAFEEPIAIAEESSRVRRDRAGHAVFARPATGDDPEFADALLGRVAVGDGAEKFDLIGCQKRPERSGCPWSGCGRMPGGRQDPVRRGLVSGNAWWPSGPLQAINRSGGRLGPVRLNVALTERPS